jgi:hypothetical protein
VIWVPAVPAAQSFDWGPMGPAAPIDYQRSWLYLDLCHRHRPSQYQLIPPNPQSGSPHQTLQETYFACRTPPSFAFTQAPSAPLRTTV